MLNKFLSSVVVSTNTLFMINQTLSIFLFLEFEYRYVHRTQNSELRNLFDIIHVFKCTAYCYRIIY